MQTQKCLTVLVFLGTVEMFHDITSIERFFCHHSKLSGQPHSVAPTLFIHPFCSVSQRIDGKLLQPFLFQMFLNMSRPDIHIWDCCYDDNNKSASLVVSLRAYLYPSGTPPHPFFRKHFV